MSSVTDYKVASMALGFSLGFGFLTVWQAIKQTKRNRNPLRSAYIYMIWGEIAANVGLGILGYLFLNGVIKPGISIIAESRQTIQRLKWGTAFAVTCINIAVFCIFIPSHMDPPERLVKESRLTKYRPLVSFNAKLMILSVGMDILLIGLMSLPNQTVFIQFHPVVYLVKLNIEMSMASLITRLAQKKMTDELYPSMSYSATPKGQTYDDLEHAQGFDASIQMTHKSKAASRSEDSLEGLSDVSEPPNGIHRRIEVKIESEPGEQDWAAGKGVIFGPVEVELPSPRGEGRPKRSRYENIERGQGVS
uniref:Integral membrane protein n=1 Tax=Fusarium oxysporum (strain Fo5176) TaxID=660025 RepID=A0A0D2XSV6_FUSOF